MFYFIQYSTQNSTVLHVKLYYINKSTKATSFHPEQFLNFTDMILLHILQDNNDLYMTTYTAHFKQQNTENLRQLS